MVGCHRLRPRKNLTSCPGLVDHYTGQKAKRGVFMTTSDFTAQGIDFARSVEGMVLVDGKRLVNLMMDHEVGVTSRLLKLPKLDSDYFDEE